MREPDETAGVAGCLECANRIYKNSGNLVQLELIRTKRRGARLIADAAKSSSLRIAIANSSYRVVAGVETYLHRIVPELREHGCEVAFFSEAEGLETRPPIITASDVLVWCISELGASNAFAALRKWRPDVIYVHGVHDIAVETELLAIAPAVFFAHAYAGTCISGRKSFRTPTIEPCDRRFGAACLAYYYVRRCGGLNPVTMWRDYYEQEVRLLNVRRYRAIVTSSEHMRREYLRHGLASDSVHLLRLPISRHTALAPSSRTSMDGSRELRLLFAGRMVFEKGGDILLEALPRAAASVGRPVQLDLIGDGPARVSWQKSAGKVMEHNSSVKIIFHPWLESAKLAAAFDSSDLLVVPSIWPEPFGLTGPEAGLHSLPAAAFAVGGIPEWLHEAVNGHLADAYPCRPDGLARAIAECVRDEAHYVDLRAGAYQVASQFESSEHVSQLLAILSA
jgi:glycosyltransferase involved in cell wall biosynthesis